MWATRWAVLPCALAAIAACSGNGVTGSDGDSADVFVRGQVTDGEGQPVANASISGFTQNAPCGSNQAIRGPEAWGISDMDGRYGHLAQFPLSLPFSGCVWVEVTTPDSLSVVTQGTGVEFKAPSQAPDTVVIDVQTN